MKKILTGALAALTLGGALAATAVPASAQGRHGGYGHGGYDRGWHDRGGYRGGDAAAAGILGLAVGAALAGGGGYSYGYAPGYYYGAPAYYAPPPRCRVEMRWNPAWRTYDRVRVCY